GVPDARRRGLHTRRNRRRIGRRDRHVEGPAIARAGEIARGAVGLRRRMGDMMDQHEDPKFEQWLKNAARTYHTPRPAPRDVMWKRIEDARRNRRVIELRPWMRWAVAAAAVLILGIGIGRWTTHQPATPNGATSVATADSMTAAQSDLIYQVAATQYLSHTEAFLTSFRADIGSQGAANSARF